MKKITAILAATICATTLNNSAAVAQLVQSWNVQARAQAERATSVGVTLLTKRQGATAVAVLEKGTQADPTDASPFMVLGMALAYQGKYDSALHALQRAYSLQQTSEILIDTGFVYYLQHDYDAAITSWTKALELNPKLCQIYGNLGFAHLRKGAFNEADAQFRKLVKCRPQSNYGYQGIALIHYLRGNLQQSRNAADRSQLTQPYAPVIFLLAKLDALQGDRVSALKRAAAYNALLRKKNVLDRSMVEFGLPLQHDFRWDPLRVDTFDNGYLFGARLQTPLEEKKRIAFAKQGNAEGAISSAKQNLLQSPNDLFLLREQALAQMAAGDYAGSVDTFKKVLDSYPECYVDLLHIARGLAMQGKGAEGAAYVKEFLSHVPNQQISPALANIGQEPDPAISPAPKSSSSRAPSAVPDGVQRTTEEHEVKRTTREVPVQQPQNAIPASDF